jgi:DNA (cytosine-5)-methyltransferase 1
LKLLKGVQDTSSGYVEPPEADARLQPAVTAREALSDLPPITLHLRGELRRGARRFDELIEYDHDQR